MACTPVLGQSPPDRRIGDGDAVYLDRPNSFGGFFEELLTIDFDRA